MPQAEQNEWTDYYNAFDYFSPEEIRPGCHPRILQHAEAPEKAIVLVQGLSDSPYFMTAIGNYFFNVLGYDVYLPLLHFHGLKDPQGMEGVELEEWKANVSYAINVAAARSEHISIGGLSTGGTLGFYAAATSSIVNGDLFLFSAALDLNTRRGGLLGDLAERLLRTFLVDLPIFDKNGPLIGENPYRYCRVDMDGARELARLIKETDSLIKGFSDQRPFSVRTFAAHSESDTTANIAGIEELESVSDPSRFEFFRIPESEGVAHPSVVLEEPIEIEVDGEPKTLEKKNSQFGPMMEAIKDFTQRS